MITIDDFAKLEFKVGTVISAEEIEGSDKLLKLKVDFGSKIHEQPTVIASGSQDVNAPQSSTSQSLDPDVVESLDESTPQDDTPETNDIRQILSGIKQWYKPEDLVGKQFVFITNLEPRKMMGLESQGMIMAAEGEERPAPLIPSEKVPNGAKIR